jgi:hypothetical protein
MDRRLSALVFCLCLVASGANAASSGVPLLDKDSIQQGSAKVSLVKGTVSVKATLARLPAQIDTGTEQFEATIYKAYLVSSSDPALEIPLANVYPTALNKAAMKTTLKGDVTQLALDKIVIVAFSKDGLYSFDVLTGTLVTP